MKKILLLFMTMLAIGITVRAAEGDEFTVDNLKYRVLSETEFTVALSGYESELEGELVIPSYVTNGSSNYSVTSIGFSAFLYSGLTSVVIPNSVTSIDYAAFHSCSVLTSVNIPNSVTSIGDYAFYNCSSLTSVVIPNSVTSINNAAFENCSALKSVTIPNSVTSIGHYAFQGCSALTSVTIPGSVTSIGIQAFARCESLSKVFVLAQTPPNADVI